MYRLACVVGLIMSMQLMWGSAISLNDEASYVNVGIINLSDIRLEINIASLHCSQEGKISLPREFDPYLSYSGQWPVLKLPVLIDHAGEYRCEFTDHKSPTPFQSCLSSDPDAQTVTVSKAYRLRELCGLDVYVTPIHTNDGNLVISDHITIDLLSMIPEEIASPASPRPKLNPYFVDVYRHHFINFECRYEDIAEYGSLAVICPTGGDDAQLQQFRDLIQPWVDWKNQKGIPTTVYSVEEAGDSYEEIKDFILCLYDNDPQLTFVQLVGDYDQLPCLVATISGNIGGMDAFYSLLAGEDMYPDIFVGRFSAETAAELYTQIQRSIEYERGTTSGEWLSRAAGVCSNNPPLPGDDDEHNWEHLDKIRAQLLAYGYTQVDRIYANEGAGTQELINCLNSGQSLVNYCGEGYPSHWVAPEFWISDAANLSNTDMLPFIHVVSCWTGQFYNGTCLAEALMRSRDATAEQARGAIAVYAAAPEQGIAPPMEAQDHAMQLLVSGTKNTIGGLCYNGSCSMIDAYGEGGVYNFLAWNLFGDASLVLRTQPATQIAAVLPDELPPHCAHLDINTGCPDILAALTHGARILASSFSGPDGYVHLDLSVSPVPGLRYLLTLTGFNRLPLQRQLACYGDGAHPVLDLTVLESGQFIEPEMEIIKTVRITNRGQLPAENVSISLVPDSQSSNLIPLQGVRKLGQIQPGGQIQTTLSFRISKGTPDLTTLRYSLTVAPYGLLYECSDVVHAPTPVLESVRRDPQINWVNPGDTVDIVYSLRNAGSAVLRNPQGILSTDSAWLQISQFSAECPSLQPGCADTLVFHAQLEPGCPIHTTLGIQLAVDADNALGGCWQPWLVTDPQTAVESFESQDLQAFPWVYQSGQWDFGHNSQDGFNCLCSQAIAADSIWLELRFTSLQAAELSFLLPTRYQRRR